MVKLSRGERVFEILNTIFLILISVVFLLPLFTVLSTSLIGEAEYAGAALFPVARETGADGLRTVAL